MGDVIDGGFITKLDLPPERVLQAALDRNLESVVILGYDQDGDEVFISSVADGGTITWMLERAKLKLLQLPDELTE